MTVIRRTREERRKVRVRSQIHGTAEKPRISVHRSSKYIYVQAIDDDARITLGSVSDRMVTEKGTKSERALAVGKKMGELLIEKKVTKGVYDRGSFIYKGRVQKVAEGLREAGLQI